MAYRRDPGRSRRKGKQRVYKERIEELVAELELEEQWERCGTGSAKGWKETVTGAVSEHGYRRMLEEARRQKKVKELVSMWEDAGERPTCKRPSYVARLPGRQAEFLAKVRLGTLPVGHELAKRGYWKDPKCPACGDADETIEHLALRCSGVEQERSILGLPQNPTLAWFISDVGEHGEGAEGGIRRVRGLYRMWRKRCEYLTPLPAHARRNEQLECECPESTETNSRTIN